MAPRQPIHYTNADPSNLEAVEAAARHFGIVPRRVPQGSWWHVYLPAPMRLARGRRNPIAAWLSRLGVYGLRAAEKFIPDAVFALPQDQVRLFLRHLWATDGSVTVSKRGAVRVYYATSSRRMADDLQSLLLRLDLRSRLRSVRQQRGRAGFSVDISGAADQRRFLAEVGVHGARGQVARVALLRLAGVASNPNVDTIPLEVWRRVRMAMSGMGMTESQLQAAVGSAYAGSSFYRHAPGRPRLAVVAARLDDPDLGELATSDLFFDRVVGIDPLGEEMVYDATVAGAHNFIADGIVVHNSIEQDADVVIFLYRDSEQNPESEVELVKAKVAKHRNGPIGEVPLQFRKTNTRFYPVAREVEEARTY